MLGASSTQPVDRQGGGAIWRSRPSALDLCRAPLPLVLLCGWWSVQIRADLLGLVRYGLFPHDAVPQWSRPITQAPAPHLSRACPSKALPGRSHPPLSLAGALCRAGKPLLALSGALDVCDTKSPNFVVSFALLSAVGDTYVVIATRAAVRLVAGSGGVCGGVRDPHVSTL